MALYCAPADVYQRLSAMAFASRPRPVEAVSASTGWITLTAHGVDANDLVRPTVTVGGSLPTGLSTVVLCTPTINGGDLLRLTPVGGSLITSYASAGSGWGLVVDVNRRILTHISDACAEIDNCLTSHATPLLVDPTTGRYPAVIVGMAARMAARAAVTSLQVDNAAFRVAMDRLFASEERDDTTRAEWKDGKPILPIPTDQTSYADNAARAGSVVTPATEWRTGCL